MTRRWECRYSSSEMLYLELRGDDVITYLYHAPNNPDRYAFADVLAGKQDAMISQLFGAAAVDEVKAAIRARHDAPPPLTKQQLREKRRLEQQRDQADRKRPGWPGGKPDGGSAP
jgi:hypothetical protein